MFEGGTENTKNTVPTAELSGTSTRLDVAKSFPLNNKNNRKQQRCMYIQNFIHGIVSVESFLLI